MTLVLEHTALFRPVARTPLSLLVSRQLREAIISGELSDGAQLPTEQELTEHFRVSRSTVREAVRVLQAQGLLSGGDTVSTARPRVCARLAHASASEALENALRLGRVSLPDLVELRLLLEGAAVASADPSVLGEASTALEVMREPGIDIAAFYAADVRFHLGLVEAGGNRAFAVVMGSLREVIGGYLRDALEALDTPARTIATLTEEHAAILAAIDEGDRIRARTLVHAHIWGFYSGDGCSADG